MDITHPTPVDLIKPTSGINNRLDPYELAPDELVECHNFVIDDRGFPNKRPGYWKVVSGIFHSLPQDSNIPLVLQDRVDERDAALYFIASDHTVKGIRSGLTMCARMSYAKHKDRVYYSNGFELGMVVGDKSYNWSKGSTSYDELRILSGPVPGTHIAMHKGRMLIAKGKHIFFSDLYNPHLFELHRNFLTFSADIIMVRPVEDGVYVSTTESTYFIKGEITDLVVGKLVLSVPAYEWTDIPCVLEAQTLGLEEPALCATWACPRGAIAGLPNGRVVMLNKSKLKYPEHSTSGAGLLYGHSYIHSIN